MRRKCACGAVAGERECTCAGRMRIAALVIGALPPLCAALIGALALATLPGCTAAPPAPIVETRIQVQRVTLPPGLLSCQPEPALGAWTLQSQVADYIVRLHEAWADCHETVHAIAQIENTPPATPAATATDGK